MLTNTWHREAISFNSKKFAFSIVRLHTHLKEKHSWRNKTPTHKTPRLSILESDASDLFVRTAYNGRVAEHAGLHFAVRREDTGEVQRTSDVSHETEATRHPGGCQGMRVGGFSSQGGDGSADSLHVQKLSCEW